MKTPSFRDMELISAYLDGQLSQSQKTRLEARLATDPSLAAALIELGQMKSLLRQVPHYKAPRNFTLTPKMAGIRPPVPRVVPALSWASVMAMMLFVCTLTFNFLNVGPLATLAPKALGSGGGPAGATMAPVEAAPMATEAPMLAPSLPTFAPSPTEEPSPTESPSPTVTPMDTMAFMTQNGTQLTGTHTPSWNDPTPTDEPTSTRVTPTATREPPTPTREGSHFHSCGICGSI